MRDREWYKKEGTYDQVVFCPWVGHGEFGNLFGNEEKKRTIVSRDRVWLLYGLLKHTCRAAVDGETWECGVYKGGTAMLLGKVLASCGSPCILRLFDMFGGMPKVDPTRDMHREGDFSDTSVEAVREVVRYSHTELRKGRIPETFDGLQDTRIRFAHVDVDLYRSVFDCCEFIWPRLSQGGIMVFDDYGFAPTAGARDAVDEYFSDKAVFPVYLPTGQAFVMKAGG